MKAKKLPSQAYLKNCFDYNPETGALTWKDRPLKHFKTATGQKVANTSNAGKPAGHLSRDGYRIVRIDGAIYKTSRIIWKLQTGFEPNILDHINGDTTNERFDNLRDVQTCQNLQNSSIRSDNKSGYKGVSFCNTRGKYQAVIQAKGKRIHLGFFVNPGIAALAYINAAFENHGVCARIG